MDCWGHGTHVAGIVAAGPNKFGFTGVALDVTLGAYRVLGCTGETTSEMMIASFMQAFDDGSDIISASSIGGPGWPEDPWASVVRRIVEKGVPCVVNSGNSGDWGLFFFFRRGRLR